jgi:hypothetical protein
MFLYDTNDYSRPNDRAVGVARGLVGVMRLLDDEVSGDGDGVPDGVGRRRTWRSNLLTDRRSTTWVYSSTCE